MTLILNNDDIQKTLNVKKCLEVMEESYREQAAGRAVNRPTCHSYLPHSIPQSTYSFKSVDGGVGKLGVLALRVTSDVVQEQQAHDSVRLEKLPLAGNGMFVGLVQLFSAATGELLAIMPDGVIQQTRVGVTSALGMKVMARKNAEILGLIGSGGQARAHYRFMTAVLAIKKVKVFSPNPEHRKKFTAEMAQETGVLGEPSQPLTASSALLTVGTGVQFAAMGYCAYRAAKEKGLGHEIPTEWFLQDIKP